MPSISRYFFTSRLQIFWAITQATSSLICINYIGSHVLEARPFIAFFSLFFFSPRERRSARLKHLKRSNAGCANQHIVPRLQLQMMWVAEERVTSDFQPCRNSSPWYSTRVFVFLAKLVLGLSGTRTSEVIMQWYHDPRRRLDTLEYCAVRDRPYANSWSERSEDWNRRPHT